MSLRDDFSVYYMFLEEQVLALADQTLVGCAGEVGLEVTQGDKTVELTLTLTQARQLVAKLNAAINN